MGSSLTTRGASWGLALALTVPWLAACGEAESSTASSPPGGLSGTLVPATQVDTVVTRNNSGFDGAERLVIRSQERWAEVWAVIHRTRHPLPDLPQVDFRENVVVVAAMGSRPTGGFSVGIEGVARAGDDLEVLVEERSPGPGCLTTQAVTSPMVAVRIPAPTGRVRFVERQVVRHC
jgi:hypothetical protein